MKSQKPKLFLITLFFLFGVGFPDKIKDKDMKWTPSKLADQYDKLNRVLDPNHLISAEDKKAMLDKISEIRTKSNFNEIIIFIDEISDEYKALNGKKDIQKFVDDFILKITKGNWHAIDFNQVILFSIKDHQVRIQPGHKISTKLARLQETKIINEIKPYLKSEKYGPAGIEALKLLEKEMLASPKNKSNLRTSRLFQSGWRPLYYIIPYILCCILPCSYILYTSTDENSTRDIEGEDKLQKIKDLRTDQEKKKEYLAENCVICMKELQKIETTTSLGENDSIAVYLECTHSFHRKCINHWIQSSRMKQCPICKKDIKFIEPPHEITKETATETAVEEQQSNGHGDGLNWIETLVDIQKVMHPVLETYSYVFGSSGFQFSHPSEYPHLSNTTEGHYVGSEEENSAVSYDKDEGANEDW